MADGLGDRMKRYEGASRYSLPWRMPVIIRVDGRAFHTFTRGMTRPVDGEFVNAMDRVALALCEEIQGARLAFVQSDEVSVLVDPWDRNESTPWFDNDLGKVVSISAAISSATMSLAYGRVAQFDSRAFVVPQRDVCNYFVWRQQDATRNSLQSLAQSLYSSKQLHGVKHAGLQEMCFQAGHNWNDLPTAQKRGRCAVKKRETVMMLGLALPVDVDKWGIDVEVPIFSQSRSYIESRTSSPFGETVDASVVYPMTIGAAT